ncbi:MAG: hypothetical protein AABO41_01040 [Acidobacteriota bacterium]
MKSASLNRLAVAAVCFSLAIACTSRSKRVGDLEDSAGEPEQYSATVVCSVDDGTERELSVTRIFKSGELRRQEWTEQGEAYALIWRPDLGKMYALDLAQRCYTENETNPQGEAMPGREPLASQSRTFEVEHVVPDSASANRDRVEGDAVERALGGAPSFARVETQRLSDKTIDGHPCTVLERRAIFVDDHVEVTTTFCARELGGLAIRVETGPGAGTGGARLITELRDIRLGVPADAFVVPHDFRKVDKLPR